MDSVRTKSRSTSRAPSSLNRESRSGRRSGRSGGSGSNEVDSTYGGRSLSYNDEALDPDAAFLKAADQGPDEVENELAKGANLSAKNEHGQTIIHLLAESTVTWVDLLSKILGQMTKEQIDAVDNKGKTALSLAVAANRPLAIDKLLEHGASVSIVDEEKRSPFQIACHRGYEQIAKKLLEREGVDIHARDQIGITAIDDACWGRNLALVELLFEKGADIHVQDDRGWTPLRTASQRGRKSVVRFLLDHGADVTKGDQDGMTPLHVACREGHKGIAELLLDRGAYVNARDSWGTTPLDICSWKGQVHVARMLLTRGANMKVVDLLALTPLMTACEFSQEGMVNFLMEQGADIHAVDKKGECVVDKANQSGNMRIHRTLILAGAYSDKPDENGWTSLMVACRYGILDMAQALLDGGADYNKVDDEGWNCLIKASQWGHLEIVQSLLAQTSPPMDIDVQNDMKETALHRACFHGHLEIAKLLLEKGKADPRIVDSKGLNALHMACQQGYLPIVRLLLDDGRVKLDDVDDEDRTALHFACLGDVDSVVKLIQSPWALEQLEGIEMPWIGERAERVPGQFLEIVDMLLKMGADPLRPCAEKMTALHLAAKSDDRGRMLCLLGRILQDQRCIRDANEDTALGIAVQGRNRCVTEALLNHLEIADFGVKDLEEEALFWAASNEDMHEVTRLLFLKSTRHADRKELQMEKEWSAMDWAAHRGMPEVLWALLCSSEWNPETDKRRRSAEKIAIKARDAAGKAKQSSGAKKAPDPDANDHRRGRADTERDIGNRGQKAREAKSNRYQDVSGNKDGAKDDASGLGSPEEMSPRDHGPRQDWPRIPKSPDLPGKKSERNDNDDDDTDDEEEEEVQPKRYKGDVYGLIVDMLRDPPITQTSGPKERYEKPSFKPHSQSIIEEQEVAIVDFYAHEGHSYSDDGSSGFLTRFRSVAETIYESSPHTIMHKARKTMQQISAGLNGDDDESRSEQQKTYTKDDLKFTWIHLPANNMKWMNDLLLTICLDKDGENDDARFRRLSSFMRKSWVQTPDRLSKTRYMKPQCMRDGDEDFSPMALYIPYLVFSKEHAESQMTASKKKYQDLLEDYKNTVIHGSRTLDEFYYHFSEEQKFQEDMADRNEDQVITKYIDGPPPEDGRRVEWTAVRVDQVWLWMLDDQTLITSSTHRYDGAEDPFLTGMLDLLKKGSERRDRPSQPNSANEMSQLIVDFCIGFFDRQPRPRNHGSVRQIFSDFINRSAIEEADLFRKFTQEKLRKEGSAKPKNKRRREAMGNAASLFRDIKDIRDELNILKAVSESQDSVQGSLRYVQGQDPQTARSITREIREMDEIARRIQNAVNTTLTLEQNDIAISQAQEGVRQGRTLMVFTVVTILFLPMSFLSSLFALDVASFQKTPDWAFAVIFCVSLAIFVPLASYSFYSDWLVNLLRTKGSSKHQPVDKPTTTPPPSRKRSLQPPPERGLERLSLDSKKAAVSVHVRSADRVAEEDVRGWKSDFKWPLRRARTYKSHDIEALSPGK